MTYQRVVSRSHLLGGYDGIALSLRDDSVGAPQWASMDPVRFADHPRIPERPPANTAMLAGDMRRLEADQRDGAHLTRYAERAGITPEQVRTVLDTFFEGDV